LLKEAFVPSNKSIDDGHAALLPLVAQLDAAGKLEDAFAALARIQQALPGHFEAEEGPGGLFEQIREQAPRKTLVVGRLEQEHVELLQTVASLEMRLKALSGDVAGFCRRLRQHESDEGDAMGDAIYTDLGGGD
jgi:hypothetical protein